MTTVVISSDNSETTIYGNDATYLTARSTATDHSAGCDIGQYLYGTYEVRRTLLKFDTTIIPVGATITRAYLQLYFAFEESDDGDYDIEIIKQDWSAQDPIDAGNRETAYDACLAGTKDVAWQNTSTLIVSQYYDSADLDVSWLAPGTYTYYSLRSSDDHIATVPTGLNYVVCYTTGDGKPPQLVVEYTPACPTPEIFVGDVEFE